MPTTASKPRLITSPLLNAIAVPHAFTTRLGGVSSGTFASLNFGNPGDLTPEQRDPASNINANWILLTQALLGSSATARTITQVHQVHSSTVHIAPHPSAIKTNPPQPDPKADALITDDPGQLIAVRVADCCPILLSSADGRVVSAIHAGWRGVVSGIAINATKALSDHFSIPPTHLIAAIGPCIGPDEFEVGPEVVAAFLQSFGPANTAVIARSLDTGKSLMNLQLALRLQLESLGLPKQSIDVIPHCTVRTLDEHQRPLYFSHRRDHGLSGRMVGIISPR